MCPHALCGVSSAVSWHICQIWVAQHGLVERINAGVDRLAGGLWVDGWAMEVRQHLRCEDIVGPPRRR
eukprot:3963671-Alexandrium_andersonii.AAC.1